MRISKWNSCYKHRNNTAGINTTTHQKCEARTKRKRQKKGNKRTLNTHSKTQSPACLEFYFQAGFLALLASKPHRTGPSLQLAVPSTPPAPAPASCQHKHNPIASLRTGTSPLKHKVRLRLAPALQQMAKVRPA